MIRPANELEKDQWQPGDSLWVCCVVEDQQEALGMLSLEQRLNLWLHRVLHRQRGDPPWAPE